MRFRIMRRKNVIDTAIMWRKSVDKHEKSAYNKGVEVISCKDF